MFGGGGESPLHLMPIQNIAKPLYFLHIQATASWLWPGTHSGA